MLFCRLYIVTPNHHYVITKSLAGSWIGTKKKKKKKKNLCVEFHSFMNSTKFCLILKRTNSKLNILLYTTGPFQRRHLTARARYQAQLHLCTNESHLPRILRTDSHAKLSPNEGVVDEICNILKVLPIVLAERKKSKTRLECGGQGHCRGSCLASRDPTPPASLRPSPPSPAQLPQGSGFHL